MKNIAMIVFFLWLGGMVFVAVGMAVVRALDLLGDNYD